MARVKVIKLRNDDLQSLWGCLEQLGCKIPEKLKEECYGIEIFHDLDGEVQITSRFEYVIPSKIKSPSA